MGEMVTTCPQCQTTFRVTSEQLNIHEGDVRCGRCAFVFNAFDSLSTQEKHRLETETPPADAPQIAEEPPVSAPFDEFQEMVESLEYLGIHGEPLEQITYSGIPEPEEAEFESAQQPTENIPDTQTITPETEMEWETPVVPETSSTEDTDELPPLKKRRRWPWVVGTILLFVTLLSQPIIFRYNLAYFAGPNFNNNGYGLQGATTQFLTELGAEMVVLCNRIGCPGRHDKLKYTDNISIESSELQADPERPSVVILNAVLRSRAKFQQDYPLLELTLTDTEDHATARRIFTPSEYLPNKADAAKIKRGMAAGEEVAIKLNLDTQSLTAVGYRLYVFYP